MLNLFIFVVLAKKNYLFLLKKVRRQINMRATFIALATAISCTYKKLAEWLDVNIKIKEGPLLSFKKATQSACQIFIPPTTYICSTIFAFKKAANSITSTAMHKMTLSVKCHILQGNISTDTQQPNLFI